MTRKKMYKQQCFLESTFYEEYFLFCLLIVKAIHNIPRFVEQKIIYK